MSRRTVGDISIKGILIIMLLLLILVMVMVWLGTSLVWNRLSDDIVLKNSAVLGALIQKYPELEGDIIKGFLNEAAPGELKYGIEAAKSYGYDKDIHISLVPIVNKAYEKALRVNFLIAAIGFFVMLMIYLGYYFKILGRVDMITKSAERIVDGDFTIKLPETNEGSFARLSHHFNRMSKILEANLERAGKEKLFLKNIISDISHQLKTPLSSLRMFNELMQDEEICDRDQKEFLKRSEQQLDRMEWLIRNLLKMARLEAGAIVFDKNTRLLDNTVRKVIDDLRAKADSKSISINLKCNKPGICLKYDENWISEAISNIIKNAIEHTAENGLIDIELIETSVMVRLIVKDNGEGISKQDLPHVFERFYKGKNASNSSSTGIGLALAKAIVENHDGIITVKSDLGIGTTFAVTFPKGVI